jgi:chemotaxis protein MotA
MGARLSRLSAVEAEEMELVIDGVLAIQAGSNPRLVAQKLRSLLPPDAARAAEAASTKKAA